MAPKRTSVIWIGLDNLPYTLMVTKRTKFEGFLDIEGIRREN